MTRKEQRELEMTQEQRDRRDALRSRRLSDARRRESTPERRIRRAKRTVRRIAAAKQKDRNLADMPVTEARLPHLEREPTRQPVAYDNHMNLIRTGDMIVIYRYGRYHLARVYTGPYRVAYRPNARAVVVAYLVRGGRRTSAKAVATLLLKNQERALRVWEQTTLTRYSEDEFYKALDSC